MADEEDQPEWWPSVQSLADPLERTTINQWLTILINERRSELVLQDFGISPTVESVSWYEDVKSKVLGVFIRGKV